MGRRAAPDEGLREAPLPGLGPSPEGDARGLFVGAGSLAGAQAAGGGRAAAAGARAGANGAQAGAAENSAQAAAGATKRAKKEKPHFHEHRERLRRRFMQAGAGALVDYELLELVLFSAPPARLSEVQGAGDAVVRELKIVEAAAHRLAQASVLGREAISSWDALETYLRARMARGAAATPGGTR